MLQSNQPMTTGRVEETVEAWLKLKELQEAELEQLTARVKFLEKDRSDWAEAAAMAVRGNLCLVKERDEVLRWIQKLWFLRRAASKEHLRHTIEEVPVHLKRELRDAV